MIVRTWSGRTTRADAAAYLAHLERSVIPELQRIAGFRGVQVLRRELGEEVEFAVQTSWRSMAAVREFAGTRPERAVVPPAAQAVLSDFDPRVRHFELIATAGPAEPRGEPSE